MEIRLARIDDRLIHGQVATVWTKETQVERIIVISDDVAKDEVRKTLLTQVAPQALKLVLLMCKKVSAYTTTLNMLQLQSCSYSLILQMY